VDVNGTFVISGGTLLAAGSSGMAVAPDASSTQGWVAATLATAEPAGTVVQIVSADGSEVTSFAATKTCASIVYSSAEITSGANYSVPTGGTAVGTFTAGDAPAGGMGMGGDGMGGGRPGG
jgi:hypothetical protein